MDIVCFHRPGEPNDYLSNWYYANFEIGGKKFNSVEQYMMYCKAITFGDNFVANDIMKLRSFGAIKSLGRAVRNYDDRVWSAKRYQVVKEGVMAKFSQNRMIREMLLSTGDSLLAECAANDIIWGIGIGMKNPNRLAPEKWRGQNLLGRALMEVRDELREKY